MKSKITIDDVKMSIRDVPDFPKKGILFKDITTALKDKEILNFLIGFIAKHYENKQITKVIGIESRGFILGSAIAYKLNAGFIPARKPGKLPAEVIKQTYKLEYGVDSIEMHTDALNKNDVVLLHDDLLATGGTASAVLDIINSFDVKKIYTNFLCDLSFLNGMEKIRNKSEVYSLISF